MDKNQSHLFDQDLIRFEQLFQKYYPRLTMYAAHILGNMKEAEDLVQDVFLDIWEKRTNPDAKKNIPAFLYAIIHNKCINHLKTKLIKEKYIHRQIKFETEELYHISFNNSGDFISFDEKLHAELEDLIKKMPQQCGTAFRLRWIEGKKIREIAEMMNISSTMVDKHLAKGIEIARNNLSGELFLLLLLSHYPHNLQREYF
jgi:RNA polymerase sigma-70 factor (ECF subfamily)